MQVRDLIEELKRFPATAEVKVASDFAQDAVEIEKVMQDGGDVRIIVEEEE